MNNCILWINVWTLWINGLQRMDVLDYWLTTYGHSGHMVYNIWMSWINGLQRTDIVDLRFKTSGSHRLMVFNLIRQQQGSRV